MIKLQSNNLVVEFGSDPAITQWKILGASSLSSQNQDITSLSIVSETTPGNYRAEIPLGLAPLATFFVKIQPWPEANSETVW